MDRDYADMTPPMSEIDSTIVATHAPRKKDRGASGSSHQIMLAARRLRKVWGSSPSPTKAARWRPRRLLFGARARQHPRYSVMIADAITSLRERRGSSRQAILKYIMTNYKVGSEVTKTNARLEIALKAAVKAGTLKQVNGTGAFGSFCGMGRSRKPAVTKAKQPAGKATKKAAKSPKKAAGPKPAAKK